MTNLDNLKKEKDSILERISYLKYKINHFKDLEHRSECPCCESKIDFDKQYKQRLEKYNEEFNLLNSRIDDLIVQIKPLEQQVREVQQEIEHKFDLQVKDFYTKNKPLFNKTTKQAKSNLSIILPSNFLLEEKKLWNRAMDSIHLDRPSMEDLEELEDLFFQI